MRNFKMGGVSSGPAILPASIVLSSVRRGDYPVVFLNLPRKDPVFGAVGDLLDLMSSLKTARRLGIVSDLGAVKTFRLKSVSVEPDDYHIVGFHLRNEWDDPTNLEVFHSALGKVPACGLPIPGKSLLCVGFDGAEGSLSIELAGWEPFFAKSQ